MKRNDRGFTLVELLLSVSLLAISVGISSDIIVSLVRTYGKTQVLNDTEQVVNFVFLKLQNDLKNATSATVENNSLILRTQRGSDIVYEVTEYSEGTPSRLSRNGVFLLDTASSVGDVQITCTGFGGDCFEVINESPTTVRVSLNFTQSSGAGIFSTSISLEDAFVVRGTY